MKTPIEALIEQVEKSPNEILTKTNVLYALNNMLPTEREHLESMADACMPALKNFGIHGFSGKEIFERRYLGVVKKNNMY
jgi:hypothetical protein